MGSLDGLTGNGLTGINFNPIVNSPFVINNQKTIAPPIVVNEFLLLSGGDFLLLNGNNLSLLGN